MMETGTETSALPVTETITTSPVPEIFIAQRAQKISNAIATPAGIEPATNSLEGCCSNPLSYGAVATRGWPARRR